MTEPESEAVRADFPLHTRAERFASLLLKRTSLRLGGSDSTSRIQALRLDGQRAIRGCCLGWVNRFVHRVHAPASFMRSKLCALDLRADVWDMLCGTCCVGDEVWEMLSGEMRRACRQGRCDTSAEGNGASLDAVSGGVQGHECSAVRNDYEMTAAVTLSPNALQTLPLGTFADVGRSLRGQRKIIQLRPAMRTKSNFEQTRTALRTACCALGLLCTQPRMAFHA
jgi:hypothetical protein